MFSQLKKEIAVYTEVAEKTNVIIPRDPQEFYADFGFLSHPRLKDVNGQPLLVKSLLHINLNSGHIQEMP